MHPEPHLRVDGLTICYAADAPPVVNDVDLTLERGEILGIVGESGAGKSTVGRALLGLVDHPGRVVAGAGRIGDTPLFDDDPAALRGLRGRRIGLILQEPLSALNPVLSVGVQIAEALEMTHGLTRKQAQKRAVDLLRQVGIPDAERRIADYPHQFSGGMRQRVLIAIALAGDPEVIVADEPTTALDVSIQAEVLDLMKRLCREQGVSVILITHDIAVVSQITDRIMVMRHGRVVEAGSTAAVLNAPKAPYTRALLATVPRADRTIGRFPILDGSLDESAPVVVPTHASAVRGANGAVRLNDVRVEFDKPRAHPFAKRDVFRAVDDVSFQIPSGKSFGIVGESGSGKSTLLMAMMGLAQRQRGGISIGGIDVPDRSTPADRRRLAATAQVIFQDPFSSLNPRMRVRNIVAEPLIASGRASAHEARQKAAELLVRVGLPTALHGKFPHQFSGGQRQRIAIARALVLDPQVLLCDEPTSALDVSIQAQILNLIKDLQEANGLTLVFVSHDLPVVRQMCDRIGVMHLGRMVEIAHTEALFDMPQDPYTRRLLSLMPSFDPGSLIEGARP